MITIIGHIDIVNSLVQLRCGKIASGSKDKTSKIGNISCNINSSIMKLTGHTLAVLSLIKLRYGKMLQLHYIKQLKFGI